jgi:hypothetical protein
MERRSFVGRLLAVPALAAVARRAPAADGLVEGAAPAAPAPLPLAAEPLAVVREARYRMAAAVRPLLVFWIRAGNVGAGRILWRQGPDGRRGYELLIGSDPARAPRRINRWGWEREDVGPEGATLFGLMRKTDEDSLDEAKAGLGREGTGGFVYKAIRSRVAGGRAEAQNTLWRVPRDYSYRDLAELQALVAGPPAGPPRVRRADVPPGTDPGFLIAAVRVIDLAVSAALETPRRLLSRVTATFTFNAALYDMKLLSSAWIAARDYGGRRYERLLRLSFEHVNREKGTHERFALVCATDGPLARVPVFIEYQPKWWFRAEGLLDDREVFA